jgi:hypothetical protein
VHDGNEQAEADVKDEIARPKNARTNYDDEGEFVLSDGRKLDKRAYIAGILKVTFETAKSDIDSIRVLGDGAVETGTWNAR